MHHYLICNVADEEIYRAQCVALEKHVPGLIRVSEVQDVDSSLLTIYRREEKEITVLNSRYRDGVYVDSEIPLEQFFPDADADANAI